MIKQVKEQTFIQEIGDDQVEHSYKDLSIDDNGFIVLPVLGGKIEVLNHNNGDDEHSIKVAKVFARVASVR